MISGSAHRDRLSHSARRGCDFRALLRLAANRILEQDDAVEIRHARDGKGPAALTARVVEIVRGDGQPALEPAIKGDGEHMVG